MFLHVDERWDWFRSYLFVTIGEQGTTCIFGVILALVCPFMFCFQNLLLGMCLFEDSTNHVADAFFHVLRSMRYQVVVLYDLTLFKGGGKTKKQCQSCGVVSIVLGYILYVLPICGLITLSLLGHAKLTVCKPLNATFLLDNDVVPVLNMSNLYRLTQVLEKSERLMWDYTNDYRVVINVGYQRYNYWPIKNITDLIKQYNFMGLHDICIYPPGEDLITGGKYFTQVADPSLLSSKGLTIVYHGYAERNSSGADKKCCYFTKLISYQIV